MEYPKRKHPRLQDYDYSKEGSYFITVCTDERNECLSEIRRGGVLLRPIAKIIEQELKELEKRYPIRMDSYVIMPDHIHVIIVIGERAEQSPAPTIGDMVCAFKSITTKKVNSLYNTPGRKFWQRGYYDHIIRDEQDYITRFNYMVENPYKRLEKQAERTD